MNVKLKRRIEVAGAKNSRPKKEKARSEKSERAL